MLPGYPKAVVLQRGTKVTIRPMVKEDEGKLFAFFGRVPAEDRLFLRDDVTRRDVIDAWCRELDYERVFPLVAEVGDAIVGDATLHRRKTGWTSHVGKVRVVVDQEFRHLGLGTRLVEELIDIAKKAGLELLVAEVMDNQKMAIAAFRHLGFEREAVFYNHVKDRGEVEHNLVVMIKNLLIEPAPPIF